MLKRNGWLLAGSALALVWGAMPAQAADAAANDAANAAPASTLNEVVVTARRKEESLQKVPTSIAAFSQQMLAEKSISSPFDLDHAVPGLEISGGSGVSNQPSYAIRGRGLNFGAAAGSVETYFADVPLSGPFQMPSMSPPFFDLQSLQVLKGPQGTLFGRSTTGGAILFVPAAPTDTFGGYGRVQVGDYGDIQVEGAVNMPIVAEKADLRVAVYDWQRKGYSHTLGGANYAQLGGYGAYYPQTDPFGNQVQSTYYDNQDVEGLRATLKVDPTDNLSNSTIVAYNRTDNRATSVLAIVNPTSALGGPLLATFPNILNLGPRVSATNVNINRLPEENTSIINTTTYDFSPNLRVKNIFGYIDAKGVGNTSADPDGSPLSAIDLPATPRQEEVKQTTDELQLQGNNFDKKLTWILGGLIDDIRTPSGNDINIFTNLGDFDTLWEQTTQTASGVFGSFTYKLTDKLSFTAGERHSTIKVSVFSIEAAPSAATPAGIIAQRDANPDLTPGGATAAGWAFSNPGQTLSHSYSGDTYNWGLDYQMTSSTLIYGGYRRGWKPGGFNAKPPAGLPAEASFNPESDDDYYIGLKTKFVAMGMPVRWNIEGYYDNYQDKQVSYLTASTTGLATVTVNVPKTRYDGFDTDLSAEVTNWLNVSLAYSYIDAKFIKWTDPSYGALAVIPAAYRPPNLNLNLAVNPVAFVSPNKVSITPRFHTNLPGIWGNVAFAPTFSYQDGWYGTDNAVLLPQGETGLLMPTTPYFNSTTLGGNYIKGYSLLDLHFEWNKMMGSQINSAFNITNVTNKVYATGTTGTLAFGVESRSYGAPRMFTFELSTKF